VLQPVTHAVLQSRVQKHVVCFSQRRTLYPERCNQFLYKSFMHSWRFLNTSDRKLVTMSCFFSTKGRELLVSWHHHEDVSDSSLTAMQSDDFNLLGYERPQMMSRYGAYELQAGKQGYMHAHAHAPRCTYTQICIIYCFFKAKIFRERASILRYTNIVSIVYIKRMFRSNRRRKHSSV
jgi:hypothetical protein